MIAFIAARGSRRFQWGNEAHDCCSFGAAWIKIATGGEVDLMASVPPYLSEAEAADILAEKSIADRVDEQLARIAPSYARRGDIALCTIDGDETIGVVEGAAVICVGRKRLVRVPLRLAAIAWRV